MVTASIEREVLGRGFARLAGVDEAGRGALFGPVVAAAVILPASLLRLPVRGWLSEINDSKLLAPSKRRSLAGRIAVEAEAVAVGVATQVEVDEKNVYWASLEAMRRAIDNLTMKPDFLLIDGFSARESEFVYPALCLCGGDRTCLSIAAASIIAKVVRDEMILQMEDAFRGYHLAKNKGYGTEAHYRALDRIGPSRLHRQTFELGRKTQAP